jgi:hypothetical protein
MFPTSNNMIPKPPTHRPNIAERISMLQMAQIHHTGYVPKGGGIRIVLPYHDHQEPKKNVPVKPRKYFPLLKKWRFFFFRSWQQQKKSNSPFKVDNITVRLLKETHW